MITLLPSYIAHSSISFNDRDSDSLRPLRFAVTYSASFLIAVGGMYVLTDIGGADYRLSVALNWLLVPLANLTISTIWVFRRPRNEMY